MTPERLREICDLTIGGTLAPVDVGVSGEEFAAFETALLADAELAADAQALAADSRRLALALAGPSGGTPDGALAERIVAALPGRKPRLLPRLVWAAAAVLVVAFAWQFRGPPQSTTTTDVETADYPLAPEPAPDYEGPRFTDVTAAAGIHTLDHTGEGSGKDWMVEVVGHGAAVFDMDGDGDLDLFVPDGNRIMPERRVRRTWRLYRNDGDMNFVDVTADSGLEVDSWAGGAVAGDVDGDGLPDLYVPCFGWNHLFRNLGDGRFEDVTAAARVAGAPEEWSTAAAMGDVDGDGDLDVYVANYADMRRFMTEERDGRSCTWRSMAVPCGPEPMIPQRDRLYLNRGDGTFVDGTDDHLPRLERYSFQPVIVDVDGDGHLDVFVASDGHPNVLLMNDGNGHFLDQARAAGVAADGGGREQACMGVAAGDFDGDGRVDFFVTNFSHEPNVLYRQSAAPVGKPTFVDVTSAARLAKPGHYTLGWGTAFVDLDLDGDLDAVTANGHLYPDVAAAAPLTAYRQHVSFFANDGTGRYREVTAGAGEAALARRVHRGLVAADFDEDGRTDLFATVLNGPAVLLRNDGRGAGGALRLLLRRANGIEAAGARVTARVGAAVRVRHVLLGSSFGSSEDPRVTIGLGTATVAESVRVTWPAAAGSEPVVEEFGPLEPNGVLTLVEGRGRAPDDD